MKNCFFSANKFLFNVKAFKRYINSTSYSNMGKKNLEDVSWFSSFMKSRCPEHITE